LAINSESDRFKLSGHVLADGDTGTIGIVADEEDEGNRCALVIPFAVNELGAHCHHLSADDFFGFLEVIGVVGFQLAGDVRQVSVIRELGGDGEELGQCATSIDFLVDVITVEEPVGRFANLAI